MGVVDGGAGFGEGCVFNEGVALSDGLACQLIRPFLALGMGGNEDVP